MLFAKFSDVILEISHGGSTAIPDMPAKPIIFAAVNALANACWNYVPTDKLAIDEFIRERVTEKLVAQREDYITS